MIRKALYDMMTNCTKSTRMGDDRAVRGGNRFPCFASRMNKGEDTSHSLLAQASIMEYILLTFFIMVVIIAIIFFLSGWQVSQLEIEQERIKMDRAFWVAKSFLSSQYFVKDDSMFDDMKLTAALSAGCEELEKIFGYEWFAEIRLLDGSGTESICTQSTSYCNYWSFCMKDKNYTAYIIPVNIYKVMENDMRGRVYIGTLKVGVYY